MKENYRGPLDGLNVLDFGHYYAGPMAAMLLADQGATVVKVVRPGAPELNGAQYRVFNRNKKLLTLDLKTEEGQKQALSLIARADVVIENFRPGVMQRLGLDYTRVREKNPGVVYLSLPGFASNDKARAHIQAWEGVLSAAAGVYTESYWVRRMLHYPPVYTWLPQCSAYGAVQGAISVMAALIARRNQGRGTLLEVPLVDAGLSGFSSAITLRSLYAGMEKLAPYAYSPQDALNVQMEKVVKGQDAFGKQVVKSPLYTIWRCQDGRHILIWGVGNPVFAQRFLNALNIDKQLKSEGFINEANHNVDCDICGTHTLSDERAARLMQVVGEVLMTKSAAEWDAILGEAGLPCALIRTREEWLKLEPMLASGVLTRMANGESALTVPGRLVDISGPGGQLMENGFAEFESISVAQAVDLFGETAPLPENKDAGAEFKKGGLLKGLKVLDFANIVAGPTSSYTLAQYGAEVIKVDAPTAFSDALVLEINQGKRSLLLDLKTGPGQSALQKLIAGADVVVHNSLDDSACRLGLNHEHLKSINPNIVSCQLTAYGGTQRGHWELRKGFDPIAPASTGLMVNMGTLDAPLLHGGMSAADMNSGLGLAFSALLGLWQQRRTGYAGEGRTSLVRSNCFFQLPCMIAENGNSSWGEVQGQDATGTYGYRRIYASKDGWVYVHANDHQIEKFSVAITGNESADTSLLEAHFAEHSSEYWRAKLAAENISCHPVVSLEDIFSAEGRSVSNDAEDEEAKGPLEILCWPDHPKGEAVKLMAPTWVRVGKNHSYKRLCPRPGYGEHSVNILKELGYQDTHIAELLQFKVIR